MTFSVSTQWPVCECSESGQLGYPGLELCSEVGSAG